MRGVHCSDRHYRHPSRKFTFAVEANQMPVIEILHIPNQPSRYL
jgi:hypothetical protein